VERVIDVIDATWQARFAVFREFCGRVLRFFAVLLRIPRTRLEMHQHPLAQTARCQQAAQAAHEAQAGAEPPATPQRSDFAARCQ
jgi:hypothetical protein